VTGRIVSRQEQERLWRLAVLGDAPAADALVRCCLPKIRRLAGRYGRNAAGGEADDLQQIGCLQAYKVIPYYKPDRGSFFNYAISAASKKMVEASRHAGGRQMASAGDGLGLVPDRGDARRQEVGERVEAALAGLTALERAVVELREGYGGGRAGVRGTAKRLGMSPIAVRRTHARAVNRLSDLLADLVA
jgi:RNA polymerase sigma factor (sigma-70 family)